MKLWISVRTIMGEPYLDIVGPWEEVRRRYGPDVSEVEPSGLSVIRTFTGPPPGDRVSIWPIESDDLDGVDVKFVPR